MEILNKQTKVLIIQTAFPGDAILTLPMIQELKKRNVNFLIDVLCTPLTGEIFRASPYVNDVIEIDKRGKHRSFFSFLKFVNQLKERDYSKIISPHRSLRSSLLTLLVKVKDTCGFDNAFLKHVYQNLIKYDENEHEVKRNLALTGNEYDNDNWKILPELRSNLNITDKIRDYLASNNILNFITVAPGSVWETKKYPIEYYSSVIKHFVQNDFSAVLIGGNEDKDLCDKLSSDLQANIFNTSGLFTIVESIELLRYSKLLICNDSAPTHLGMCADIPVLTIYCSTVPEIGFYPYNNKSSIVSLDSLDCKPCGIHGYNKCPINTFDCGILLKPEQIILEAEKLLSVNV